MINEILDLLIDTEDLRAQIEKEIFAIFNYNQLTIHEWLLVNIAVMLNIRINSRKLWIQLRINGQARNKKGFPSNETCNDLVKIHKNLNFRETFNESLGMYQISSYS